MAEDLALIAHDAVRQMLGPSGKGMIGNADRAHDVMCSAPKYAAGKPSTRFAPCRNTGPATAARMASLGAETVAGVALAETAPQAPGWPARGLLSGFLAPAGARTGVGTSCAVGAASRPTPLTLR